MLAQQVLCLCFMLKSIASLSRRQVFLFLLNSSLAISGKSLKKAANLQLFKAHMHPLHKNALWQHGSSLFLDTQKIQDREQKNASLAIPLPPLTEASKALLRELWLSPATLHLMGEGEEVDIISPQGLLSFLRGFLETFAPMAGLQARDIDCQAVGRLIPFLLGSSFYESLMEEGKRRPLEIPFPHVIDLHLLAPSDWQGAFSAMEEALPAFFQSASSEPIQPVPTRLQLTGEIFFSFLVPITLSAEGQRER
ncbi:MAG: hypothetical protein K0S07_1082, partial [Chlamydiales bacterium]|nr:hypothetical protein [Chlamydiales bacterium]